MSKLTVIASHAPTMRSLRAAELASYQCGSCKNETVALASCDPFCSHCGSPAMKERSATTASVFKETEEAGLTSAQCTHCLVANVMLDSELATVARTQSGHVEICCVECGTGMHFKPEVVFAGAEAESTEESDESESEDDAAWAWEGDQPSEEAGASDDAVDEDDAADEEESAEDESEAEEEEATADNPMIIMPKQKPSVSAHTSSADEEESEETDEEESAEDESESEEAEVNQSTQSELPSEEAEPEDMNIDMLDAMSEVGLGDDATVAFIPLDGKILANVNDQTVAVLHSTPETANADIFGQEPYMAALAQTFHKDGLEKTLAGYGFHRNSFKAPKAVAKAFAIAKAKEVATAETAGALGKHIEKIGQCLQLATAGMTRGMFRNVAHVVKDRLIADLAAAGVQGADRLVERALAETEDEHNQNVLALAQSLTVRSDESLSDLAETIASVNAEGDSKRSPATPAALESALAEPLRQVSTASFLQGPKADAGNSVVRMAAQAGSLFGSR